MTRWPLISGIVKACGEINAFQKAALNQADA
jgi:hypothetical protein